MPNPPDIPSDASGPRHGWRRQRQDSLPGKDPTVPHVARPTWMPRPLTTWRIQGIGSLCQTGAKSGVIRAQTFCRAGEQPRYPARRCARLPALLGPPLGAGPAPPRTPVAVLLWRAAVRSPLVAVRSTPPQPTDQSRGARITGMKVLIDQRLDRRGPAARG